MTYNIDNAIAILEPILKQREGYKVELKNGSCAAYKEGKDIPTIGWGTTRYANGQPVKLGDIITKETAQLELMREMKEKAFQLKKIIDFPCNDYHFASLLSFAYNAGVGKKSYLGDRGIQNKQFFYTLKNTGDSLAAAKQMETSTLTIAGGDLSMKKGLLVRRKVEADLMRKGANLEKKKSSSNGSSSVSKSIGNSVRNLRDYFGFFLFGE